MRIMKWAGLLASLTLIVSCFFPWVTIESKDIVVSGVEATGTTFGKPGYLHFILTGLIILMGLINRLWSIRVSLFLNAFNMAWAIRNFFVISTCYGGECPVKHTALYLVLISSILMMASVLLSGVKEK